MEKLTFEEYKAISKEITKLCHNNQCDEALALCKDEYCRFNKTIQIQKINILYIAKEEPKKIIIECEKAYSIWKDEGFIY